MKKKKNFFIHDTSIIDKDVSIGDGTKIWHWSHISEKAKIGKKCNLGQNVYIGENVSIGNEVKIQNNVSIYSGVTLKNKVFCGPSVVFTNIKHPRSFINQKKKYFKTIINEGVTLGANSTILCGISIGKYSFVGAGSTVTKNVPNFSMVVGTPAKVIGKIDKKGYLKKS